MILGSESNIVIFLMIAIIAFFVYYKSTTEQFSSTSKSVDQDNKCDNNNETHEQMKQTKHKHHKKRHERKNRYLDGVLNILHDSRKFENTDVDVDNDDDDCSNDISMSTDIPVNTEFVEMQYHRDYNDTITAINNLTPQKELFNLGYLPVRQIVPDPRNMKTLVKLFMNKLNAEITNNVHEYLNVNSAWTDMGKRRREKSGFETQMEELGLPGCLYNEPAEKAPVSLVKIDRVEQSNTNDQIRFTAYIIIQKVNVRDQMVLQVNFFMEREDLGINRDDRDDFFKKGLDRSDTGADPDQTVVIEQVFTLGYLTDEAKHKTKMDNFYDYKEVNRTDGTFNQEEVIKTMLKKHKERQNELDSFMCTLDNDTKEIHGVPDVDNYSQYKHTRTIMDDLAEFPQKSFGALEL